MPQQRLNVQVIAQILYDKISEFENAAKSLEECTNRIPKEVGISESSVEKIKDAFHTKNTEIQNILANGSNLIQKDIGRLNAFSSDLSEVLDKKRGRVPNWVLAMILGCLMTSLGAIYYSFKQHEAIEQKKEDIRSEVLRFQTETIKYLRSKNIKFEITDFSEVFNIDL